MASRVHVFESAEALFAAAAEALLAASREALAARGRFTLAMTGGETAVGLYRNLAQRGPDFVRWQEFDLYWSDERCVPRQDAQSNFRMAKQTLLDRIELVPERVHPMPADAQDLERASADYARLLPTAFDLMLLGIGPEGHVCSLFPGHAALAESRRVVTIDDSPKPPARRMTVTPPVLEAARELLVMVTGEQKAAAVGAALAEQGSIDKTPARLARRGRWLLDRAAAKELPAARSSA